ncbi:hypothetical protein GMSM_10030 [Geomonas sp. Red276]
MVVLLRYGIWALVHPAVEEYFSIVNPVNGLPKDSAAIKALPLSAIATLRRVPTYPKCSTAPHPEPGTYLTASRFILPDSFWSQAATACPLGLTASIKFDHSGAESAIFCCPVQLEFAVQVPA